TSLNLLGGFMKKFFWSGGCLKLTSTRTRNTPNISATTLPEKSATGVVFLHEKTADFMRQRTN
ncbi:MAG: hypothetical protein ACKO1K_05180, partial [Burkholderiales bacterium]